MLTRIFVFGLFVCAGFSTLHYSQTPTSLGKIVVINSAEFGDDKAGIVKYVSALRKLSDEFAPVNTELRTSNERLETMRKEIAILRQQMSNGTVPVKEQELQQKMEAADRLELEIKYKSEDAKMRFERRQQSTLSPVMKDIYAALQGFSKEKGFALIFDLAKDETGVLAAIGDEKAVVTKDFIAYYNARNATPAAPK